MRKAVYISLCAAMALALAGCGGSSQTGGVTSNKRDVTEIKLSAMIEGFADFYDGGEEITHSQFDISYFPIEDSVAIEYNGSLAGKNFAITTSSVANPANRTYIYEPIDSPQDFGFFEIRTYLEITTSNASYVQMYMSRDDNAISKSDFDTFFGTLNATEQSLEFNVNYFHSDMSTYYQSYYNILTAQDGLFAKSDCSVSDDKTQWICDKVKDGYEYRWEAYNCVGAYVHAGFIKKAVE